MVGCLAWAFWCAQRASGGIQLYRAVEAAQEDVTWLNPVVVLVPRQ